MNMTLANAIYNVISGQDFYEWHSGKFDHHVLGEKDCATKDEILADIEKIFGRLDKKID